MTKKPITFDDFVPGREIGSTDVTYSDELSARWQRIFGSAPEGGAGGAAEGAGLAVVMMMRAFLTIVSPPRIPARSAGPPLRTSESSAPPEAELIAFCRSILAGFQTPKSIRFVDALPRTGSGKISKRLLREPPPPTAS